MSTLLTDPIRGLLSQLQEMLEGLTDEEYNRKIEILSSASVGQHTRHIIEFFLELFIGYATGIVDYDKRKRDGGLETNREYARNVLQQVVGLLDFDNKALTLVVDFGDGGACSCRLPTNFYRELVYNLEHTVHHMALLRIGVNAVATISLPVNFGVAMSTIKYMKTCAR
jgi:hypothetical protein